jgi:hypothetical protein
MYCQGQTQAAIAALLGLSQQQVSHDLLELRKRWRERALADTAEWVGEQLAKIDWIEREAMEAWARSKEERQTTNTERVVRPLRAVSQGQQPATEQLDKASVRRYRRDGNVDFLTTIQWCISERCKILGLYKQQPQQLQQVNIQIVGVDPNDI